MKFLPSKLFPVVLSATFFNCLLMLFACSPNSGLQGRGQAYLQGEWVQQPETVHQQLVNYTLYHYRFTCDSFYVTLQSHSRVNYGADTCMGKGRWTEYAKGRYEQQHDTLMIKGFFCNSNFKLKTEGGCFRSGVYQDLFKVTAHTDSTIQLNSLADVLPVRLRLVKRIICNPKKL